jgi:hypothetical protein
MGRKTARLGRFELIAKAADQEVTSPDLLLSLFSDLLLVFMFRECPSQLRNLLKGHSLVICVTFITS